jgi:hypothetical protein
MVVTAATRAAEEEQEEEVVRTFTPFELHSLEYTLSRDTPMIDTVPNRSMHGLVALYL